VSECFNCKNKISELQTRFQASVVCEWCRRRQRNGKESFTQDCRGTVPLKYLVGLATGTPRDAGYLLISPFPIDDIPERPALEIGTQIVAEEIDGAMTVLIAGRRDMRRDQYPGIGPEP
jgi:hypothetical protein